jgi:nucleotidyltransferase substrate binding protein (TIGR01987 family)
MEEIKEKINVLLDALKTLEEGVTLFYKYEDIFHKQDTDENEQLFKSMRDSLIQRFEYCIDLLWKIAKTYLELVEKITLSVNSPRGIIREVVKARLLSEDEGSACMEMVEARNKTSHTYHEIMAEEIAHEIPEFYELMQKIAQRMQQRCQE